MSLTFKSAMPTRLKAVVIFGKDLASDDRNIIRLLDFFGIPWEIVTITQLVSTGAVPGNGDRDECCILSSAAVMAESLRILESSQGPAPWLTKKICSVYVYGFQDTAACRRLLQCLTNNEKVNICSLGPSSLMSVTNDIPEMCGPMSGLRVAVVPTDGDQAFRVTGEGKDFQPIISTNEGALFARVAWRGTPFYLNACRDTINIESSSESFFDVRKFFGNAVPITMYLKWAFAEVCWKHERTSACLIVDDPLLKARYGFLHFRRALELMDEHSFTMSLAFIPWNWRRTDPSIVQLFQDRSDRFSVSIHGCDHTANEFATRSPAELNAKTKIATRRMEKLRQETSLEHDCVMIFPQGRFSPEVGLTLKINGFLAAVNTEVAPSKESENKTRIADLWDVANNRYDSFPIFTRRYVSHGIENFAFDTLLGKPCFLVAHHDGFKDEGRALVELVDGLNSLYYKPVWTSLGDAVRHSVRTRVQGDGMTLVQIYASRASAKNPYTEPRTTQIIKEESNPESVYAVTVNEEVVVWSCEGAYLRFTVTIPPQETAEICVLYSDTLGKDRYPATIGYRVKASLRRFLSEARDQYVSQSDFLSKSVVMVRRLLK